MPQTAAQLNPYATFLGTLDPIQVIESTPATLARLIHGADEARLTRAPAVGKWSVRDIISHLADAEIPFAFRLRQTVAEAHHVMQPWDQELWARHYGTLSTQDALAMFTSLRIWDAQFVRAVGESAMDKVVTHPERGQMTFRTIVETMGGHDINHIRQIEKLV
ncbi:MAG: DinB family protein [Gemmatimonadaceae bacterium]